MLWCWMYNISRNGILILKLQSIKRSVSNTKIVLVFSRMKFLPTLALAGWTRRSRRAGCTVTLSSLLHFHISLMELYSSRPPSITLLIILILNLYRAGRSPSSSCYIGDKNCCTDKPRRSHSQIFERTRTVRFLILKYKFYCRQRMLHDN